MLAFSLWGVGQTRAVGLECYDEAIIILSFFAQCRKEAGVCTISLRVNHSKHWNLSPCLFGWEPLQHRQRRRPCSLVLLWGDAGPSVGIFLCTPQAHDNRVWGVTFGCPFLARPLAPFGGTLLSRMGCVNARRCLLTGMLPAVLRSPPPGRLGSGF